MKRTIQYIMKSRVLLLFIIFILAFSYLGYKIIDINIMDNHNYKQAVLSQQITNLTQNTLSVEAKRGTIFDHQGIAMAQSRLVYDVIYDAEVLLANDEAMIAATNAFLAANIEGITAQYLEDYAERNPDKNYKVIAKAMNYTNAAPIMDAIRTGDIKGVNLLESYERVYPYGVIGSAFIGNINGDGSTDYGMEAVYNDYLTGYAGRKFGAIDEENQISQEDVEASDGYDVYLNIDFTLQAMADDTLMNYFSENMARSATIVTMDPNTGAVLASSQYPNYDPNNRSDLSHLAAYFEYWDNDKDPEPHDPVKYWYDHNASFTYEPGSTFKAFTMAMALEEQLISDDDSFYCGGQIFPVDIQANLVNEKAIKCHKLSGHGWQSWQDALANSCNVALVQIGDLVGEDTFESYFYEFGFDSDTGFNPAYEVNGKLADYQFNIMELLTASFGQGPTVTPAQLITGFSSLINGGVLYEPQFLDKIMTTDGRLVYDEEPTINRKVISEEVSVEVRDALRGVVDEGTGSGAAIEGYTIGGKTGTSQKTARNKEDYVVSFIGFAPVDNPQVITLVVVDEPQADYVSSKIAATIFKEYMEQALPYLKVPKSYGEEEIPDYVAPAEQPIIEEETQESEATETTENN